MYKLCRWHSRRLFIFPSEEYKCCQSAKCSLTTQLAPSLIVSKWLNARMNGHLTSLMPLPYFARYNTIDIHNVSSEQCNYYIFILLLISTMTQCAVYALPSSFNASFFRITCVLKMFLNSYQISKLLLDMCDALLFIISFY